MAWKTCLLLIFEHLRFFAKAMTRDDKHFLCNTWNLQERKCNYPKKVKHFVNFFVHFWNLHQIFNILKKKIMFFSGLQTQRNGSTKV